MQQYHPTGGTPTPFMLLRTPDQSSPSLATLNQQGHTFESNTIKAMPWMQANTPEPHLTLLSDKSISNYQPPNIPSVTTALTTTLQPVHATVEGLYLFVTYHTSSSKKNKHVIYVPTSSQQNALIQKLIAKGTDARPLDELQQLAPDKSSPNRVKRMHLVAGLSVDTNTSTLETRLTDTYTRNGLLPVTPLITSNVPHLTLRTISPKQSGNTSIINDLRSRSIINATNQEQRKLEQHDQKHLDFYDIEVNGLDPALGGQQTRTFIRGRAQ